MATFIRADGNWVAEPDLTRRAIALALAGGYAVAAYSADAEPITTDTQGLVTETVEIQTADRKIPGFLARPAAKGRHPVVFVNSEIFGVHEWVKDICRRLAKAGYVALAPDLFVRAGDPSKTSDFKVVMDIVKVTPGDQVTSDTAASLKYLAAQPFTNMKKLGVTGFCWGGGATWLCWVSPGTAR
jgi:carboxymethylenebutenolidase